MQQSTLVRSTVTVGMKEWLRKAKGFQSCVLDGEVTRETAKAIYLVGHAAVRPTQRCYRCGHVIENPVSQLVGYGPYCSDYLGIPRDVSKAQIEEVKRRIIATTKWEGWLPKGSVNITVLKAGDPPTQAELELEDNRDVVKLTVVKNRIYIRSPFAYKDAIKSELPGRQYDKEQKMWHVPATPSAAGAVWAMFGKLGPEIDGAFKDLLGQFAARVDAAAHKTAGDLPDIPITGPLAPWLHQKQAFHFASELDALGLFMDMGTGKSRVVVDLIQNRDHKRVLIICPRSVVGVWPKQFSIHGRGKFNVVAPRATTPGGGSTSVPQRSAQIKDALERAPKDVPLVCVINYEATYRSPMAEVLLAQKWDLVVLDESHRIKAPGGKASMFCGKLGRRSAHRAALTGTPMPRSPLDIYAQYRFLDPGIFGTSFAAFRNRYAVMGGYGGHEVLGYQNQDDLAKRMYSIAFRVMAEDVLDLIPVLHEERSVPLEPEAQNVYRELYANLVADVGVGRVNAANALVKILRLQQVTSGALPVEDPDDDTVKMTLVSTAKRNLLSDTIEPLPTKEPIVVFCRFKWELGYIREVAEEQGRRYGELSGKSKDGLTEESTMREDIDVLGVQIQSGGVGIDLTRARYHVYLSTGHNNGDYMQSLKRGDRPGQERQVVYYHLFCDATIDKDIHAALADGKSVTDFVMGLAK